MRSLITCLLALSLLAPLKASSVVETALQSVAHLTGSMTNEDGEIYTYGCSASSIAVRKFLTAAHCIADQMKLDGHLAFAVKVSAKLDLAVLVSDYSRPPMTLRMRPLERMEEATGLGYGYSWQYPTVTEHKALMFKFTPDTDIYPGTWFLHPFIGGMSGGPIIDVNGEVVGIVQRGNNGVGYGVDTETNLDFLYFEHES